ncbi:L-histidine N(alpha)-methyltransferase [Bacteroidota bacterium]
MAYLGTEVIEVEQITITNHLKDLGIDNIRKEIIEGLSSNPKHISSKFFYDEKGSKLFEEITRLPEYYPTRTEKSILKKIAHELMNDLKYTDIVELGSGDCSKINILLEAINRENLESINYIPVDVSQSAIQESSEQLFKRFPDLTINGLVADFINQIDFIPSESKRMFCFLGSTLGNFDEQIAFNFLKNVSSNMNSGDTFLLGLDLVKPIQILYDAYNDKKNVTADFNKNILNVVNEIIATQINPDDFEHHAFFNKTKSRIEMHLKAKENLSIISLYSTSTIQIKKGEYIHTENSYKFSLDRIKELEQITNLKIKEIFTDENKWFALVNFKK